MDNNNATVMLGAAELGRAVRSVLPARSKDFAIPVLMGLHLWVEGEDLWVEATNRYTIARHRVGISTHEGGTFDAVIDAAGADQLAKLLPKRGAGHVTLRLGDGVSVELASGMGARLLLVEGDYPNLAKLFLLEARQDDVPATVAWDVRRLDEVLKCVKALDPKGGPRFNMTPGAGRQHGLTLVTLPGWEGWSAVTMPLRIDS